MVVAGVYVLVVAAHGPWGGAARRSGSPRPAPYPV